MNYQEQIDTIMDNFNFHRVHLVMEALDWTWHSTDGTPDEPTLRARSRTLLKELASSNNTLHATGGFTATKDSDGLFLLKLTNIQPTRSISMTPAYPGEQDLFKEDAVQVQYRKELSEQFGRRMEEMYLEDFTDKLSAHVYIPPELTSFDDKLAYLNKHYPELFI